MAFLIYEGVGIMVMAVAVPRCVIDNYKYTRYLPEDQIKEVADKIGIYERRFANADTCSSDLCFIAVKRLIKDNGINKERTDLLVFTSQAPDYQMPTTSAVPQDRLKLSHSCVAFGISLGCSAFCYGPSVVHDMMQPGGIQKTLILDGETRSKVYPSKGHRSAFLFGNGGAVALVERDEELGESYFSLNSDGSRADLIMIKDGGYRHPSSEETLRKKVVDEYGNTHSDEQGYMQGGDVFNFMIRGIPCDIKKALEYAGDTTDSFDYIVFYQVDSFINAYIAKKMKLDPNKIPSTIAKYGNTSSVPLPLTTASELKDKFHGKEKLLLSVSGIGMTWATSTVSFVDCKISDIVKI